MRQLLMWLTLMFALSACVTGEQMQSVREGMSKEQVVAILGNPDGFQRAGDYEALRYTNRLISGWSWDRADYNVILRSGRVVEYGPG
ncbi:MAG: outer membrane protein assembly factor BamE domain-containing protein, partial [Betaproteobacteria bacterium]